MTFEFTIPGKPEAQGRPRAVRHGRGIRMYDPRKSKEYKDYVALIARQHAPKEPTESALGVRMKIYRQMPKSTPKYKRERYNAGIERPLVKPDIDNYTK